MLIAIFNNLPELLMGAAWTGLAAMGGRVEYVGEATTNEA